jgi:dihydroneopterin aldolase
MEASDLLLIGEAPPKTGAPVPVQVQDIAQSGL